MSRRRRIMELAGLVAALGAGPALARPAIQPVPREMPLGQQAPAPVGYVDFCAREAADCPELAGQSRAEFDKAYWTLAFRPGVNYTRRAGPPASIRRASAQAARSQPSPAPAAAPSSGPGARIALTKPVIAELERVSRDVNARIIPTPDHEGRSRTDRWDLPLTHGDRRGDCEDYVLEKRHALIGLGYPQQALSIALVRTRWDESHAVLVVETNSGAYVLDSYSPWLAPWSAVPYRWVVRQSPADPAVWVEVLG